VSNLSFDSKLLERVVQTRLQGFLDSHDMLPLTHSIYRRFHSTETAVTTICDDLLLAADSGQVSALCLLDLMAAFDTDDYDLLLLCLESQFDLHSIVLISGSSRTCQTVFSYHLQQPDVVHCLQCVLCSTRVCTWSVSFYFAHGGPCRCSTTTSCKHPCIC